MLFRLSFASKSIAWAYPVVMNKRPATSRTKPYLDRAIVLQLSRSILHARTRHQLLHLVREHVDAKYFDEKHCASALVRLSKFLSQAGPCDLTSDEYKSVQLLALKHEELVASNKFRGRQYANLLWAFAVLPASAPSTLHCLTNAAARGAIEHLHSMAPQELAITMWALTHLQRHEFDTIQSLTLAVQKSLQRFLHEQYIQRFQPQELANMIWAFATLRFQGNNALQCISAEAARRVTDFTPQGLSRVSWAVATLRFWEARESLIPAIAAESRCNMQGYDAQAMSNIAWACTTLDWHKIDFLVALAVASQTKLSQCTPQALVLIVGSLSTGIQANCPQNRLLHKTECRKTTCFLYSPA